MNDQVKKEREKESESQLVVITADGIGGKKRMAKLSIRYV
jgi:hypothetical protein